MEQAKENEILRGMIKMALLQKAVRITRTNEFHREISAIAKELGVSVEEVREIVVPMITELFNEMIATLPISGKGIPNSKVFPTT